MKKDTYYFSHDFGARNDPKLQSVMMEHGVAGLGVFWCIIEILYEQCGYQPINERSLKTLAFTLHTDIKMLESVIKDFDLFKYDEDNFWSESVIARLKKRDDANEARRQKRLAYIEAKKGSQLEDNSKTTSSGLEDDSDKGKEKKGKESKGKERKGNDISTNVDNNQDNSSNDSLSQSKLAFDAFRVAYKGTKRGLDVELADFKRKYKNWKEIIPLLMPALERMMAWRQHREQTGGFLPQWPNLKTWLNQARWETEYETDNDNPNERNQNLERKGISKPDCGIVLPDGTD